MIGPNTTKVTAEIRDIPKGSFAKKALKTISGMLVIGLAILFAKGFGAPWYVSVTTAMVGAHIMSGELVGKSLKFIVATLKDVLVAVRGSKTEPGA